MLFKARLCGITEAHCFSLTKLLQKQVIPSSFLLNTNEQLSLGRGLVPECEEVAVAGACGG